MDGDVGGKNILIIDDMIDSGGTIVATVECLKKYSPKTITIVCTHPIFSDPATEKLARLGISVIGTDTVYHSNEYLSQNQWFKQIKIGRLILDNI